MTELSLFNGGGALSPTTNKLPRPVLKAVHEATYRGYVALVELQVSTALTEARIKAISATADRAMGEVAYLTQRAESLVEQNPAAGNGLAMVYQAAMQAFGREVHRVGGS